MTAIGSGAGLAVAFNAPVGGALFVLEEVTKSAKLRLVLVTAISCAAGVACLRVVLADHPDFEVAQQAPAGLAMVLLYLVFGLFTGLLGVGYNKLVIGLLAATDRMRRIDPVARAGVIGAMVGLAVYVSPLAVGDGDALTQLLLSGDGGPGGLVVGSPVGYFLVRLLVGPLSYAAGAPGGLFAPLLALGAVRGVLFHAAVFAVIPAIGASPIPLAGST